ncbi:protein MpCupin43 [Marchantia polymorpha subsp. ruderalis]|uniref:JmjC domain-containing protein n=1 Tax=Marchantia polymorpha TaxID=3197 RepID=A0A2R6W167_MARPO|nr:hypothetical protein MARPO_0191s0009 [Marchantia polymorpha]PTQ27594.1 hypothetical protein MARPO_0191s0009 [Marchantia polymorpha]BBN03429.1 hypothetical protein Mp_2g23430 [Marchantia polymorpha subsp. ruderalis]BBN03430.1 hypothetical protein Mp_2g23430 [Marchantia polymorpha subsp. ruderalis]|eukprot:PTQ27592.1 hypothetical protein MARPO_0191s0009 [Marchantia polymorpha]
MEQGSRRSKRARVPVDYARLDSTGFSDSLRVQHKKLARAVLKFEEQPVVENFTIDYVAATELADHVHTTGFRNPCVVRTSDVPPSALGIRLPDGALTVERISDLVGRSRLINTIDVTTQSEGPIYTMQEWVEYFASPSPRKPLLNVVSLDLANTALQAMVSAPDVVKELDLVDKAWPASVTPSPKVQLYTLMSGAGCFMDFHIDFGGSSVWYHVLSGRKVFLVIPPTRGNLMAFEEWASSDRQASVFFADRVSGCQKLELAPGDTLLLPGGWSHCVVTPMDSVVLGGNFLTGYNLSLQLEIWQMEERLKVKSKFRFPFYKELMWRSGAYYMEKLNRDPSGVTKWERQGVLSLTKWLKFWLSQMKEGEEVPKEISQSGSLIVEELSRNTLFSQEEYPSSLSADCRDPASTLIEADHFTKIFDDNEEEFDPPEEADNIDDDDEDDQDFSVDDSPPASRTKAKKSTGAAKRSVKSPRLGVRGRLLKKCGIDPRSPLPRPKIRPKVVKDTLFSKFT